MPIRSRLVTAALLFAFCMPILMHGQRGFEVGGGVGVSYYFGDLNTNFDLANPRPAGHLFGRFNFDERISAKLGVSYARVIGDDSRAYSNYQRTRNLDFFSDVWEGVATIEFNFLSYFHGSDRENFTPYLFAGIAGYQANPKTKLDGEIYALREFGTEGQGPGEEYALFNLGLAYGGGIKWDLSYYWSMFFEVSGRYLFSDYLDDVSTVYPDFDQLEALRGPIAVELSDRSIEGVGTNLGSTGFQRGNSKNNDSYNFALIGIAYYFGRVKCPPISRPHVKPR